MVSLRLRAATGPRVLQVLPVGVAVCCATAGCGIMCRVRSAMISLRGRGLSK